jgi:hypothetical protein
MPRLLDTLSGFEAFARKAGLETPYVREGLWKEKYEAAYPDVFEAFYASHGSPDGRAAIVRQLSEVRKRLEDAAPAVRQAIADVESAIPDLLGVSGQPTPLHVLMVGTLTTNAAVGRLNDEVAVFHCLEWFQTAEGTAVLVAHETTHAWHELALGGGARPPEDNAAWVAFSEGLAIAASRALMPGRPESDYFWYGHPDVETWLPWCEEHRQDLLDHFRAAIDVPDTVETYFGGGTIDGQWRVGYYLADVLVKSLDLPLRQMVAMSVDEAQAEIRQSLGADARGARPPSAH